MTAQAAVRRALSTWTAIVAAWALALSLVVTAPPASAGFDGMLCSGEPVPDQDRSPAAVHADHDCCLPQPAGAAALPPRAVHLPPPPSGETGRILGHLAAGHPGDPPERHPQSPRAPPGIGAA